MITVRRDAVRTQGRAPEGGGDQQSRRGCQMRHFCHRKHFEITGHTKPTFPCQQHSCRNAKVVPASTVVTDRNSSVLKVSLAARQCQRLRSTKVSIRSRSSACSRLVSTERPHRNLSVRRIRPHSECPRSTFGPIENGSTRSRHRLNHGKLADSSGDPRITEDCGHDEPTASGSR